jgi:poly-gamma-glutamate system protein
MNIFKLNTTIKIKNLLFISMITILSIFILNLTTQQSKLSDYDQMLSSAQKMKIVYAEISNYRLGKNLPINELYDPNITGFIGEEFSLITTTLGNLDAKQISLNPDFAALITKWILSLNISSGNTVVIHASASFPALTIMAILACEELNLKPVIFTSVGASSWGANIPDMTYLDIENHLHENQIIKHRSSFVTPGGTNDNGSSLWEGGMEIIEQSAVRNNYTLHVPASLKSSIAQKWSLINKLKPSLFINIGGNHSALGDANCALQIPVGLITEPLHCPENGLKGLIYKCALAGIPFIHFLNIKDIAFSNGIDVLQFSFDKTGQSDIYYQKKISLPIAIISFLLIFSVMIIFRKKFVYNTPSNSKTISTNLK